MKIVIDIPDSEYLLIKNSEHTSFADFSSKECMMHAIRNGKPYEARPQGEWLHNSDHPDNWICSACNCGWDMWRYESKELKYCPNCGAKMTKEAENEEEKR